MKLLRTVFCLALTVSLFLPSISSAQSNTPASELGRAIGTLLGNLFSNNQSTNDQQNKSPIGNDYSSNISNNPPTQESMQSYKQQEEKITEYLKNICSRDDLKNYFEKTTCRISDLSMTNLTDSSKITPAQKKVLLIVDDEFKKVIEMDIENLQANIKPPILGKQLADVRLKYRVVSQKTHQDLYLGKITWGEYNTNRRDIAQVGRDEFINLSKQYGY